MDVGRCGVNPGGGRYPLPVSDRSGRTRGAADATLLQGNALYDSA